MAGLVTAGPYLLAALLTHGKTLAIGGGDIKLMGGLRLCSGSVAWFATQHFISDPGRAYRSDAVWSTQTGLFFHPAATCPVLLHWRRNCFWLAAAAAVIGTNGGISEQEYFQKPDDHRSAVCILLTVLVCFGITPLFNAGLKAQTEAVRVKAEVFPVAPISRRYG